jgi:hypothetical protein
MIIRLNYRRIHCVVFFDNYYSITSLVSVTLTLFGGCAVSLQ